jgi:hypothetical protein
MSSVSFTSCSSPSSYTAPVGTDLNARRLKMSYADFEDKIARANSTETIDLIAQEIDAETKDLEKNANLNMNEKNCWDIIAGKLKQQLIERQKSINCDSEMTSDEQKQFFM